MITIQLSHTCLSYFAKSTGGKALLLEDKGINPKYKELAIFGRRKFQEIGRERLVINLESGKA